MPNALPCLASPRRQSHPDNGATLKTNELTSMLANGIVRTDPHIVGRRFATALFLGFAGATSMLVAIYGVRGDMPALLATPIFWLKVAFPLAVVGASLLVATRLSRPGAPTAMAWVVVSIPLLLVWLAALGVIVTAPPTLRLQLVLGSTWQVCTLNIAFLSVPTFVAMFWAMKGLAPTRPALAGAAIGLLSGAQAALAYTLYCIEMSIPFWGVWYVLGMLVPTFLGGLFGPRVLRW
jgi:hypothetical protein